MSTITQSATAKRLVPATWLVLLSLGVVIIGLADIALGSVSIPLRDVAHVLVGQKADNQVWNNILVNIRIPKTLTAMLAGMALSVSGLQLQTLFRNPLAGPSVLGISAGASLGVATVMLASGQSVAVSALWSSGVGQGWLLVIASSAGAAVVLLLILAVSLRVSDNIVLLIIGIMIGNITLAVVSIWQYFSQPEQIRDYLLWTLGSVGNVTNGQLQIFSSLTLVVTLVTFLLSKNLNGLLLGERYARSMGIPLLPTRIGIIATTSILVGLVTGFCGPIGFIGIAVPHLVRSLLNTSDHRWLIPASALAGAFILIGCDLVSQWPGQAWVLPINAITALIGSPVVIWVILHRRNLSTHFR
ncbi:iron ABC transporter permease [Tunicatimonas pelagia]|uniref:iron ABC transporter permease n=1 Tax=Tunicatimonas pelagia TaxID=931531 RepID=UPI002666EBFB|nr:iron ABC transporter permease [Tunicatimonas pelagia]WKN42646.1 iron ABC transporter permease [Tunicatimonas pelagia]